MTARIDIRDYAYELPPDRIASHPPASRDQSKLLVFKNRTIDHRTFAELPGLLDVQSVLFFNDTKVIPARLLFQKETGTVIEVFLLEPLKPSCDAAVTMTAQHSCVWRCTVGNLKRWNADTLLAQERRGHELAARMVDPETGTVEFRWDGERSFAEVLETHGQTPLPPYIRRNPVEADRARYQTVYAHHDGAVAAPTAGLHFTEKVISDISARGIAVEYLTLHVGAGTFFPVKNENALDHIMHEEQVTISKKNLENILGGKKVVAVGTTSMRVLESIYWYGNILERDPGAPFMIAQDHPYKGLRELSKEDSLRRVLKSMDGEQLSGKTSIYLLPGYEFKVCDALVTNFHQPASTLILLVAAFVGPDWRRIYREALAGEYRFLSYGDCSLLFPHPQG